MRPDLWAVALRRVGETALAAAPGRAGGPPAGPERLLQLRAQLVDARALAGKCASAAVLPGALDVRALRNVLVVSRRAWSSCSCVWPCTTHALLCTILGG